MGKTRDHFKKIRDTKGIFYAKMSTIKNRNSKDPTETEEIKKRWQGYTDLYKKALMTQITVMLWSDTQSETFCSMKSNGPQKALLRTKLEKVMEFHLSFENTKRCYCYIPELNMPANLESSAVATGRSNSQTWNNGLVQNWERNMSRLYIATLLI